MRRVLSQKAIIRRLLIHTLPRLGLAVLLVAKSPTALAATDRSSDSNWENPRPGLIIEITYDTGVQAEGHGTAENRTATISRETLINNGRLTFDRLSEGVYNVLIIPADKSYMPFLLVGVLLSKDDLHLPSIVLRRKKPTQSGVLISGQIVNAKYPLQNFNFRKKGEVRFPRCGSSAAVAEDGTFEIIVQHCTDYRFEISTPNFEQVGGRIPIQLKDGDAFFLQAAMQAALSSSIHYIPRSAGVGGTVKVQVMDSTGASIPNAEVTISNYETGTSRTSKADSEGILQFPALPDGRYRLKVNAQQFQATTVDEVNLFSQDAEIKMPLRIASGTEVVEVEAAMPIIETTTMTVGQTFNQRTVEEIPLNGRHFVDLALLMPGSVSPPANGFLTAPASEKSSAVSMAGDHQDTTAFVINGINLTGLVRDDVVLLPSIDTASVTSASTATDNSRYDHPGAIVDITTQSGGNDYHGRVFYSGGNEVFNARDSFNPAAQRRIDPFRRNEYGGTFSGPIWRDHTFFMLGYEGLRQKQQKAMASAVLTGNQRNAIIQNSNPTIKSLLQFIPQSNGTLASVPGGTAAAFFGSGNADSDSDQGSIDISHTFSPKDTAHAYFLSNHTLHDLPAVGATIPGFGERQEGSQSLLTLNETHIFNGSLVNNLRAGLSRSVVTHSVINTANPNSLGIDLGPNVPDTLPNVSIDELGLSFGSQRNIPRQHGDVALVLNDTVSYIQSRHSFLFGVEGQGFRNNNQIDDPGALTFLNSTDFANDQILAATRTVNPISSRINVGALAAFAGDQVKLTPDFSLTLGLRYTWNMTPSEAADRFVVFDSSTASLQRVQKPYGQNNTNFQPKVGFSWDFLASHKTLLRGGYAIQVIQPDPNLVIGLSANPPFAFPTTVYHTTSTVLGQFFNTPKNITPISIHSNFKNADIQFWNLDIGQQFVNDIELTVGYSGLKGTHLQFDRNINQFTNLGDRNSRPFTSISLASPILPGVALGDPILEHDSSGNSSYNAFFVNGQKRMSHGFQLNASYTWSHSIDDLGSPAGAPLQDSNRVSNNRGDSNFDTRHRFTASVVYDLPWTNNGFVKGWEVGTLVILLSGNPFTPVVPQPDITGVLNSVRPNVKGDIHVTDNPLANWFADPSIFSPPNNSFGNLSRNSIVGPGFKNIDFSVAKITNLKEGLRIRFQADAFNILNHPNYAQPGYIIGSVNFGVITSTRSTGFDSGSARRFQLGLKVLF